MKFKDIDNIQQLSAFLKTDEESLNFYLKKLYTIYDHNLPYNKILFEKSCLEKIYIDKKNKRLGKRVVYKIKDETYKNLNKVLFSYLNSVYKPHICVQGFTRGRNTSTNASLHLGKKLILNLDIENFFESINTGQVINVFLKLGCKKSIAEKISKLTTVNEKLVLGFNTSPIIANLVVEKMDNDFINLSKQNNYTYSRYADDICFSSDDLLPKTKDIENILRNNGFNLNKLKTRIMKRGEKQYVTGLTIFDKDYPRIPKRKKKKIRLLLYYLKKYGTIPHLLFLDKKTEEDLIKDIVLFSYYRRKAMLLTRKIKGWIDYINSIEPELAQKFYLAFDKIKDDNDKIEIRMMKKTAKFY